MYSTLQFPDTKNQTSNLKNNDSLKDQINIQKITLKEKVKNTNVNKMPEFEKIKFSAEVSVDQEELIQAKKTMKFP